MKLDEMMIEYFVKKNALDNKTDDIVIQIREWCKTEVERINEEFKKLQTFMKNNLKYIGKVYNDDFHDKGDKGMFIFMRDYGIEFTTHCDECELEGIYDIGCDVYRHLWIYGFGLRLNYDDLPQNVNYFYLKPNPTQWNWESINLDHWMNCKEWLKIYNRKLKKATLAVENLVKLAIEKQNERFNKMFNIVNEIDNNEYEIIKVRKITIE